MELNKLTIPEPQTHAFALQQLEKIFTYNFIMQKYGWNIGPNELIQENDRILKNTRSPALLEKVRAIPGFDPQYYLDIFVRGTLVQRLIYNEFYFSIEKLHQDTLQKAEQFAEKVKSRDQNSIKQLAEENNLAVFAVSINTTSPIKFDHLNTIAPAPNLENPMPKKIPFTGNYKEQAQLWFQNIKVAKKVGGTLLLNEGEVWALFFPKVWDPKNLKAEGTVVRVPKTPFNVWIAKEMESLKKNPEFTPQKPDEIGTEIKQSNPVLLAI